MPYLLDTTALSEPMRRSPQLRFMERLRRVSGGDLFTSSVCVMELRYGCALKGDSEFWRKIEQNVLNLIHILPFGHEEAMRCGDILSELSQAGTPIGIEDTQIGATALVHGLTVVTSNTKHFEKIAHLTVENWHLQ